MSISQENFYRLIKPYDSNLLHVSSTMMGGASKCYKELKKVSPSTKNFSIINTKTNQLYEFDINNNLQMGGGTSASLSEIELLKRHIESLEKRIIKLEDNTNNNINKDIMDQPSRIQNEGVGSNANVNSMGINNDNTGVSLLGIQKTLPPQRPELLPPMMKTQSQSQATHATHATHPIHQMHQMHQSQPMQPSQQALQMMQPMQQSQQMQQSQPMHQSHQSQQMQQSQPMQQPRQTTAFNQELARKFI
jgi:hypothetical protein